MHTMFEMGIVTLRSTSECAASYKILKHTDSCEASKLNMQVLHLLPDSRTSKHMVNVGCEAHRLFGFGFDGCA